MDKKELPKVLIVEDSATWQHEFAEALFGKVKILPAYTLSHADSIIEEQGDQLQAVVLDGMIHTDRVCDTIPLVEDLREKFPELPLIAMATIPRHRDDMVKAGCNYSCTKKDLPAKLYEILNLA